ncbi:MAG: CapA family protein, partial [Thermoplasmatota archaeon]
VNGLTIGLLAYTENVRDHWAASSSRPGPLPLDPGLMESDIRTSSKLVDILIVSIHWRKWPQYTEGPEDSDRALCRKTVEWGADVIMGHGPHTVHEVEGYGEGLILYSLGNAAMNTGNESSYNSYIAKVRMEDGSISELELLPIKRGTYRYVPMGTPIKRYAGEGFNVSRDRIQKMYENDIYGKIDEERGFRELLILWDTSPILFKALFICASAVIILLVTLISISLLRRLRKTAVKG